MKILLNTTIPLDPTLGSGYTRLNWANGFINAGHQLDLNYIEGGIIKSFPRFIKLQISLKAIFLFPYHKLREYDVLEFYGDEFWFLTALLALFPFRKPLIIHHADGIELLDYQKKIRYYERSTGLKRIYKDIMYKLPAYMALRSVKYLVCGCEDDESFLKSNFPSKKIKCISPGIDQVYIDSPITTVREKQILYSGSWIARKGVNQIPKVISEVLRRYPSYRFTVIGASSSKDKILALFDSDLQKHVTVHPKLSLDLFIKEYQKSNLFFFPSYSEGFGLALAEAMACGCAPVVTPTGLGSQLENNYHALVCPFDDTDAMVGAICKLIENKNLRDQIAINAKHKIKELDWMIKTEMLIETYKSWIIEHEKN